MRPFRTAAAVTVLATALTLTACGASGTSAGGAGQQSVTEANGVSFNLTANQHRYTAPEDPKLAAEVPAAIRARGTLEVVDSAQGAAPLSFFATDNRTVIGVEPDLASAVADVLGLKVQFHPVDWAQIFVGLDSGKYDVGFSNITDTELRKQKYDFATYRKDNIAFEARKGTTWRINGPKDVAGKTIAVSSGTTQEKILLDWSHQDVAAGLKPVDVKYYSTDSDTYLALQSGRIDAYLGPNPTAQYHAAVSGQTEVVGVVSGAGEALQGLIGATTKKDSGLVTPLADAIDELIADGTYGKILVRWGLTSEALTSSRINPPGLPLSNS
ncbi:ABC transporter substrate-binding protein [Streptacidiphilus fuscans]|uniref:ABC transporter substrate-binding protein n=1 Tax=Streptacidiphilus fuscans TaxID=2789292 RepID=A0A931B5S9_9ACTN|nr:ABC transporter substrate-binding protein [Streptacidiphilus fuscans]MBF9069967.1 ABC transporter substrate-binding protein [Streptacidiphilus fuscans]